MWKPNKPLKIDNMSLTDLYKVQNLSVMLFMFDIAQSEDLLDDVSNYISDNFCSECESTSDRCECNARERYIDEDKLYDEWRDQQLMEEKDNG